MRYKKNNLFPPGCQYGMIEKIKKELVACIPVKLFCSSPVAAR